MRLLKQSTAYNLTVFMTDSSDHVSGKTGLTLTITASKDGAAFASISPTVTELANGWYKLALTSSHTDTLGDLALHVTATGADPTDVVMQVRARTTDEILPTASYTAPLDAAGVRAAVGLAGADLDTQLAALPTAAENADAVWDEDATAHQTQGTFGQAIGDPGADTDTIWALANTNLDAAVSSRLATAGYTTPPTVGAIADQVWEETLADHWGTAGSTAAALNAAGSAGDPWSTALPGAYGAGTAGKIVGDNLDATVSSRLASASITLASGKVTVGTNDDKTGYSLSAAAIQAIWDALTSALTTVGSIGKLLVDNLNATISSRLASASYTAPLDAAGVRSAVGLAAANLDTQLSTIDTVADAIQAKTDNLPTDPADESLLIAATDAIMTRLGAPAGASMSADVAAVKTQTDAIETDTQDLQSRLPAALTSGGRMKSDALAINGTALTGDGSATPWGPA